MKQTYSIILFVSAIALPVIEACATGVAVNDTIQSNEDEQLIYDVVQNDTLPVSENYTVTLLNGPMSGSMNWTGNGHFEYLPEANFNGTLIFQYILCNELNECDTADVIMYILSVNDAPVVEFETYVTNEDTAITGDLSLNDFDSDSNQLIYSILDDVPSGLLSLSSNGEFTYTPNYNFYGQVIFNYWCCDAQWGGACTPGQVVINVLPVNDPPYTYNYISNICQDILFETDLTTASVDSEGNTVILVNATCADATINFFPDGIIQMLPNSGFIGPTTVQWEICDNYDPPACITGSKNIIVHANQISFTNLFIEAASCSNFSDGSLQVTIQGGIGNFSYSWDGGQSYNSPSRVYSKNNIPPGIHTLSVTDNANCASPVVQTFEIPLAEGTAITLDYSISEENCYEQTATVALEPGGGIGFAYIVEWPDGFNFHERDSVAAGEYEIIVMDSEGCHDTLSISIELAVCTFDQLIIPEGFSPDGDGVNDVFEMPGIEYFPNNSLTIFNQWGTEVFAWEGYTGRWNGYDRPSGKLLPEGTYYYVLKVHGVGERKGYVIIQY